MSMRGTTWFKNSRRKLVAIVAGAAILAGAGGVVADTEIVEAAATRSVEITVDITSSPIDEIVTSQPAAESKVDSDKDAVRKRQRPQWDTTEVISPEVISPEVIPPKWPVFPPVVARSTWS